MSLALIALLLFLATSILLGAAILAHSFTKFRERTLDDVRTVLREVDVQILEEALDQDEEIDLRLLVRDREPYRREMRARLDIVREHTSRAAHNGLVVLQWASTEHEDMNRWIESYDAGQQQRIIALYREGKKFRRLALAYVTRTWFLCLWRFDKCRILPVPSVAALRRILGRDYLEAYKRLVEATAALGLIYGEDDADELRSRMWTQNFVTKEA
jgi:hypothetical protein